MQWFEILGGALMLLCALVIVVGVAAMEGKSGSMNALSGGNDSSYLGKHKNKSAQAQWSRVVKFTGIAFVLLTLVVYIISAVVSAG